jgi:formate dehydrogenase iron-sulfur subunit
MKGILTDISRCIGCQRCVEACVKENALGADIPERWTSEDGLSAQRFTSIVRLEGFFVRKQCRHCLEPACASACPVGALHRTPGGPVVYDRERCLGCRYCMMACPYGIPRYAWGSPVPYVRKCTMCYETRLREGRQPACTEACPTGATIFGDRDDLLAEARRRQAAAPQANPLHLVGEREAGGSAVLYLTPVPLAGLDVGRAVGERPLPERTRFAMAAVPPAFVGMGIVMGSLYWIIERRNRLARERGEPGPEAQPEGSAPAPDDRDTRS